ncbi:arabinose operon transcriptional regulator AraC [Erwinia amylovora]|uniref:arabinose operon transcriptional regulator AraC n=1 Tax=Erwinia amylovora TaxID=552 RepID=UPI00200A3DA4|nr:arabinose operon transcriptional regulator AraC [Erwinia amylovora]MCK8252969.1 arabinose operon transcriptional regulator AraC [Erwinia amylovora]MCK8296815.1 arabinose operon transcriptional regulator AraC [Erwinia amylovora]
MFHRLAPVAQSNPLLPGYLFSAWLVAGLTPIDAAGPLDFYIDRPQGMQGFILNLTIKGRGRVANGQEAFDCEPGDVLLFQPETAHYYGRSPDSDCWYHRWIYFRPRAYWSDWLSWQDQKRGVGRLRLSPLLHDEFERLFVTIEETHNAGRRYAEELAMNLLERLLLRAIQEDPRSQQQVRDARVVEACQYVMQHLAAEVKIDQVARHVCLSPSRLAHLFRQQMGVNLLRWREDQRVQRARLLLQSTRQPIASVGREVGYDDQLYFSRVFRKRAGVSPSDFGRRSMEAADVQPGREAGS